MPIFIKPVSLFATVFLALTGFTVISVAWAGTITNTTSYEYQPVTGLLAAQVREPSDAQLNLRTQFTYDQFGNQLTTQLSSTATGFGAIAPRTASTVVFDANGITPSSVADALGHTVQTGFTSAGLPMSQTDQNGLTTTWQYDGLGRKTQEQRPDGTITRWQYLLCGTAVSCTGQAKYVVVANPLASDGLTVNGAWTKTYLDRLDRIVRIETLGYSGVSVVDTEYDAQGRVARFSRPYFANAAVQWTGNSYDAIGRVVAVTSPDGSIIATAYSGLTARTTNALNQTQTLQKNSVGQVVKVTDTLQNSLSYIYDANGNLTKTIDPHGNTITMWYDIIGRKLSMTDPDLGIVLYLHDALGQLRQQTNAKSSVTTMSYDILGRMLSRTSGDLVSSWIYDNCVMGKGRLCRARTDSGYSIDYSFDGLGRSSQNTTNIDAAYTSKLTYDANSRVATMVYPTGLTIKNVYGTGGYLTEIRNNATNALYWQANAFDAAGRTLQQVFGNGVVTQHVFDIATGRTKNIYAGAGNSVQNLSFTYDTRGNMLTRNDANQNLAESFLYDPLNRLTSNTINSASAGMVTQTYAYDNIGNMTARSDLGQYSYGAINARPHAVTEIALAGGGKRQYTYDANGNLIKEEQRDINGILIAAKGRTATYTSFDLPVTLANSVTTLQFLYGAEQQRVKQIAPAVTTVYVHPGNMGALAYEKDVRPDGAIEHRHYISGPEGVVALVKQTNSGTTTSFLHRDHIGSTTAVTAENGTVLERMAYEPFGKRRMPAGMTDPANAIVGSTTDRGYTNHEHLEEVGLIHMNGRIYDPVSSRFMTADPTVPYATNIQSYNRYAYTRNNPLVRTDPSGFCDSDDTYCDAAPADDTVIDTAVKSLGASIVGGVPTVTIPAPKPTSEATNPPVNILLDSPGAVAARQNAAQRDSYWAAVFGGEYSVMDPASRAGHAHGQKVGLALDAAAVAAPILKGVAWLRSLSVAGAEAGSIRGVNSFIKGRMNCVNCVIATDAVLAGRPASALGGGPFQLTVLEKLYNARFSGPRAISDISDALSVAGPGARGIVFGSRGKEVGHVFNVINQEGTIRYLDGQSGSAAVLDGYETYLLLRTN